MKNQLAKLFLLAFIMQLSMTITTTNAVNLVHFDIYKLLSIHGFQSIGDKFKPKLQTLSDTFNKFFTDAAVDPPSDVPFLVNNDFGQLARALSSAMTAYGKTMTDPAVAKKVNQAAVLLQQLATDIKLQFGPLVSGRNRSVNTLYSPLITDACVDLSDTIGKMLTPEESAKKFLPVIIEFFEDIGRAVDEVLRQQLPNLKAPVDRVVQKFDQTWINTMKQIGGIFKV